jgi:hypothetical protein
MNTAFYAVLSEAGTADPRNIVDRIFALFTTINNLSAEEVIAAYQTYRFFRNETSRQDDLTENRLLQIERALIGRMVALCSEFPAEERPAKAAMFCRSMDDMGKYFYFQVLWRWGRPKK